MSRIGNIYLITSSSSASIWENGAFWDLESFCTFAVCLKTPLNASMKTNHRNVKYGFGFSFVHL